MPIQPQACAEQGIKSVAVSAGYMCEQPRREFYAVMDAANIDLKAFTVPYYRIPFTAGTGYLVVPEA